jgi:2-polyprenyl-3-methyl-5-hydroxy-6-metoxy-1,4-benzoquinol methylase
MQRYLRGLIFLLMATALLSANAKSSPQLSAAAATEDKAPIVNGRSGISSGNTANPPVECPLRKQGINPHDLRPFADTQKYIDFLERSDRAAWQKPDAVIKELHLSGTEKIADVGAGSGYFTFRFARALPGGTVYAIDIEPEMLRHIHHKAMTEGVRNIEVIKSTPDGPNVPSGADLVFVCDVLHHVKEREAWLKKLSAQMKTGARLAVIEFKDGDLPEGPPAAVKIPKKKLIAMIAENNFKLERDNPDLLPYQTFLIFVKP